MKVKFGRGVENKYGQREYASKCGRYKIVRKTYVLPVSSVAYNVHVEGSTARLYDYQADTLAEAKEWCREHANPSDE